MYWLNKVCPCITKHRGVHGFYMSHTESMMSLEEIMRFQGYSPERLGWRNSGVCKTSWGKALGDAMSLNVLRPVLVATCTAAGLI